MRLAVKLWGFNRICTHLSRSTSQQHKKKSQPSDEDISTLARLINAVGNRKLVNANCLAKSLTLWWMLRRQGVSSDLRIGVKTAHDHLQAHAWLELNGAVLNDSLDNISNFECFGETITPVGLDGS